MTTAIIGIDCATRPEKTGLALGEWAGGRVRLDEVRTGAEGGGVCQSIRLWLKERQRVLLCLDAPLGWPVALATSLSAHEAGARIDEEPDRLFTRSTDRLVREVYGIRPLEVGADRIARTAHAALLLLFNIRSQTGFKAPLAWTPDFPDPVAAIEVYPAATLKACGLPSSGYRKPEDFKRNRIIGDLQRFIDFDKKAARSMIQDADLLDAAICVLAGADFLSGLALAPDSIPDIRREGWIWIRKPETPMRS